MHKKGWTRALVLIALPAIVLTTDFVLADIYKCVSDDGVVMFSDEPCSKQAEVFLDEEELILDVIVASGAPFTNLSMDDPAVDEALLSHARKVGKCLLVDEKFNNYSIDSRVYRSFRFPEWNIELFYGPPGKPNKWRIRVEYAIRHVDNVPSIWLTNIYIRRWGEYQDPPDMQESPKLEKVRVGHYRLVGWLSG